MKNIFVFLMICGATFAEEYRIPKGFQQATVSNTVVLHDMYLKDMRNGDNLKTLESYVIVDEDNHMWLNPKGIGFDIKSPAGRVANVEVSKSRLGWFVKIPFRYKKINGYSVPIHSQWRVVGKVPYGYIPVLSARVIDPVYQEPSEFRKRSLKMGRDYEPSFKKPVVPPNPYEMEKDHVLQPFVSPGMSEPSGRVPSAPSPGTLPELESIPKPVPRPTPNPPST